MGKKYWLMLIGDTIQYSRQARSTATSKLMLAGLFLGLNLEIWSSYLFFVHLTILLVA
jgi:hypothetical protein